MQLATIQSLIKVPKSQFNSFGKYKYRSCEDIVEAVKPVINPLGFSLTLSDSIIEIGGRIYVQATATITNGNETYTATAYAREEENKKGMDASQVTGAASSYARKYALNGLFAIDDTKDADGTNTHDEPKTTLYNHKEIGTKEKPLITNAQFKSLMGRLDKGDFEAGKKALETFSLEPNQLSLVTEKLKLCQN